jgi:PAS domain S-box-containing protein
METASDGIILIDGRGTVSMFNPACERLFEYPASEVIGQNIKMLMPPSYRAEHDGYMKTGERKMIAIGREVVGQRKNGSTFPMELSVGEATQEGESIFVGFIHDLTERKRAADSLLRAQMEMAGQLSGRIAHDLNSLLTVIVGNAEFLSERLEGRKELQPLADDIGRAGERGARLTQQLLVNSHSDCAPSPGVPVRSPNS